MSPTAVPFSFFFGVTMDMYGYSGVMLVKRFLDNVPFEVTNMSDISKANPHGCDNGALTDRFGVLIQGLLAIVAFSTLMCEYRFLYHRETHP